MKNITQDTFLENRLCPLKFQLGQTELALGIFYKFSSDFESLNCPVQRVKPVESVSPSISEFMLLERGSLPVALLLKCSQQSGLDKTKVKSLELDPGPTRQWCQALITAWWGARDTGSDVE